MIDKLVLSVLVWSYKFNYPYSYRGLTMSHIIEQEPSIAPTRTEITDRMVGWLGEGYRGPIESLIDDYAKQYNDNGACCESEVHWCVHIAKGHQSVDLEMALLAAEVLGRLGLDPVKVKSMRSLTCPECA